MGDDKTKLERREFSCESLSINTQPFIETFLQHLGEVDIGLDGLFDSMSQLGIVRFLRIVKRGALFAPLSHIALIY